MTNKNLRKKEGENDRKHRTTKGHHPYIRKDKKKTCSSYIKTKTSGTSYVYYKM